MRGGRRPAGREVVPSASDGYRGAGRARVRTGRGSPFPCPPRLCPISRKAPATAIGRPSRVAMTVTEWVAARWAVGRASGMRALLAGRTGPALCCGERAGRRQRSVHAASASMEPTAASPRAHRVSGTDKMIINRPPQAANAWSPGWRGPMSTSAHGGVDGARDAPAVTAQTTRARRVGCMGRRTSRTPIGQAARVRRSPAPRPYALTLRAHRPVRPFSDDHRIGSGR